MDPKPIKRTSQLLPVSREHHFGLLFCWKIRQGIKKSIAVERMLKYLKFFFDGHLKEHFADEERLLFTDRADTLVQAAISHHIALCREIESLLNSAGTVKPEQLGRLADKLDEHIRFEERTLFPHLEQVLPAGQLDVIGEKLHDHNRDVFIDIYPDEFWLNQSASL
ncbi:MAG: hemerythrin domain-containing protein [Sphingobacteriales bacterium]|nr:hemerythrin domain-containing protein [Sphingobacteriales bacterium]